MKQCCQSGNCGRSHYNWSEVRPEPLIGIEWAAIIAMMLSALFAGTTIYLMVKLHEATGRFF